LGGRQWFTRTISRWSFEETHDIAPSTIRGVVI